MRRNYGRRRVGSVWVELHSPDTEWSSTKAPLSTQMGNVIRFGSPMSAADESQADE
jgi:hypothetical protein